MTAPHIALSHSRSRSRQSHLPSPPALTKALRHTCYGPASRHVLYSLVGQHMGSTVSDNNKTWRCALLMHTSTAGDVNKSNHMESRLDRASLAHTACLATAPPQESECSSVPLPSLAVAVLVVHHAMPCHASGEQEPALSAAAPCGALTRRARRRSAAASPATPSLPLPLPPLLLRLALGYRSSRSLSSRQLRRESLPRPRL